MNIHWYNHVCLFVCFHARYGRQALHDTEPGALPGGALLQELEGEDEGDIEDFAG